MNARSLLVALCAGLSGCMVGPNYQRPDTPMPEAYRGQVEPAKAASFGDEPWWDVFRDPVLQDLVRTALASNLDVKKAVARVEQARANVQVARAPLYPWIGYGATASRQSGPFVSNAQVESLTYSAYFGAANLSWEIDLWGKVRRATEAAQADLLATEDFQRGVTITLLAEVASSYFELLALDRQLAITRETVAEYRKTVSLFRDKYSGGASSELPVNRAAAQLANAAANIPQIERQIFDNENRLSILLGRPPGPILRGAGLDAHRLPPEVPAGLPSQLLERRPDVRQSEQVLIAQNALIGVAEANFFPSINLTGLLGTQHSVVSSILAGTTGVWGVGAGLLGPLFMGGQLTGELEMQKARWTQAKAAYEQTLLTALSEVSSALDGRQKLQEVRDERDVAVRELRASVELALDRYLLGLASYFEVLQAEEDLYSSEIALTRTRFDQLANIVELYRALGGGWQLPPEQPTTDSSGPAKQGASEDATRVSLAGALRSDSTDLPDSARRPRVEH
jgi:multidrug efflux system outer membrane protein